MQAAHATLWLDPAAEFVRHERCTPFTFALHSLLSSNGPNTLLAVTIYTFVANIAWQLFKRLAHFRKIIKSDSLKKGGVLNKFLLLLLLCCFFAATLCSVLLSLSLSPVFLSVCSVSKLFTRVCRLCATYFVLRIWLLSSPATIL